MIQWDDDAWQAVEKLFQDPTKHSIADRLEELLNVLTTTLEDPRVRRIRMQNPKLWAFTVGDAQEIWTVLWEYTREGEPYIHYAGPGLA